MCSQLKVEDVAVPGLHPYWSSEMDLHWYYNAHAAVTTWDKDEILFYSKGYLAFVHYIQETL